MFNETENELRYTIVCSNNEYLYEEIDNGGVVHFRSTKDINKADSYRPQELDSILKDLINYLMFNLESTDENSYVLGTWVQEGLAPFHVQPLIKG
ncbi:hypothetical protein NXG04_07540 [Klebsiella pneumoniae]|nr:hypothetical protein [Klebsiella pneumoniae]MDS7714406.1 hypothetical protein [Klebsiella pneumoniae]UUV46799.1 hypothetical protein [Bacillus phage vB_BanS-Thrax4]